MLGLVPGILKPIYIREATIMVLYQVTYLIIYP